MFPLNLFVVRASSQFWRWESNNEISTSHPSCSSHQCQVSQVCSQLCTLLYVNDNIFYFHKLCIFFILFEVLTPYQTTKQWYIFLRMQVTQSIFKRKVLWSVTVLCTRAHLHRLSGICQLNSISCAAWKMSPSQN